MVDKPLFDYGELVLTHVLGHTGSNVVGKMAVSGLGGGSTVIAQDDPPDTGTTPVNSLWYETDTGIMFVLIDDGSSIQWLAVGQANLPNITVSDTAPSLPAVNDVWIDTT